MHETVFYEGHEERYQPRLVTAFMYNCADATTGHSATRLGPEGIDARETWYIRSTRESLVTVEYVHRGKLGKEDKRFTKITLIADQESDLERVRELLEGI